MARPARRQPSQSQRAAPTQSQRAGPSRSQASRRQQVESDEEAEEMDVDGEGSENDADEDRGEDRGEDALTQKVNDLVRLALFHEARRLPLKREDINKKAVQDSRYFKVVFSRAQMILESTFGLQLQELPSKAGLDQEAATAAASENKKEKKAGSRTQATQEDDELEEKGRTVVGKKKAAAIGSKTYILRSTLDSRLIERANKPDAEILEEEALLNFSSGDFFGGGGGGTGANNGVLDDDEDWDDSAEVHPRTHGSIISWTQNDQLGTLGILYVILALILVNGKVVQERVLRNQLKELGLPSTPGHSPIHFTTIFTHRSMKVDDYLSQLLRQGYLDRQIVGEVTGAGRKRARGKVGGDANNDGVGGNAGEMYEWRWGARALCEVGEEDIAKFVAEFMVDHGAGAERGGGDDGEEEEEANDGRRKARVQKMYKGVEKAAGGTLAEIRDWSNPSVP
ncbi:MAGE-domain-containing protein [Macrolepiota fuliginosa MF-IS2]|uniref:MAGE-domain-containing protein n=1 Tax=Macrolepiota fuliginosa MF-IS2 TaxID=1400762 RepID=A0A9P5XBQ1_9AGAR|nr:MAGE-domain-containing protein [Macrolepiota fuliginosa MF-IS2]